MSSSDGPRPGSLLDVVVIGAGQAGLSAAHHLLRLGLRSWEDVVVLDGNDGPGGAWRHRWDSLTFDAAHGIHDLPGLPLGTPDPHEPASRVVAGYYGEYEQRFALPVLRPAAVMAVEADGHAFLVTARDGRRWRARAVVNATGTWDSPWVPSYPGADLFTGEQLHTHDYTTAADFTGRRVLVVGGGTSALGFLRDLDGAGVPTVWSTRRTPDWSDRRFDTTWGRDVENAVAARTGAGLSPLSVVASTGLPLTRLHTPGIGSGLLLSRGALVRLTPTGAVLAGPGPDGRHLPDQGAARRFVDAVPALPGRPVGDGEGTGTSTWEVPVDVVLWATGFRASLRHLAPLRLREAGGGITVAGDGVTVVHRPGLFVVGYGASASTVGATRAGRRAAAAAVRYVQSASESDQLTDESAEPATA